MEMWHKAKVVLPFFPQLCVVSHFLILLIELCLWYYFSLSKHFSLSPVHTADPLYQWDLQYTIQQLIPWVYSIFDKQLSLGISLITTLLF